MAPWGGAERLLGINPLGIAIPAGEERPIVYDGAFGASAHGKIRVYQQKGQPMPEGWALDRDGARPPIRRRRSRGCCCRSGGYKGAGLGA